MTFKLTISDDRGNIWAEDNEAPFRIIYMADFDFFKLRCAKDFEVNISPERFKALMFGRKWRLVEPTDEEKAFQALYYYDTEIKVVEVET